MRSAAIRLGLTTSLYSIIAFVMVSEILVNGGFWDVQMVSITFHAPRSRPGASGTCFSDQAFGTLCILINRPSSILSSNS